MALALNQSIYRLPPATQLDQLAYGNEAVMEVISESLIETKFTGITVSIGGVLLMEITGIDLRKPENVVT